MHHLLQELGYMARRGHHTGIISTYEYTWLLDTNRNGDVRVSDAIHSARKGDDSCASVTEVDKPFPLTLSTVAGALDHAFCMYTENVILASTGLWVACLLVLRLILVFCYIARENC